MNEELLPEELQIINQELRILEETIRSLRAQCQRSNERFRNESARSRELTSILVAARKDEDKQMLASDEAVSHALKDQFGADIKTLSKMIEKPYFARIELEEVEKDGKIRRIEYKIGFAANSQCRIIDWRKAPISKLYYEYKEGEDYSELVQGKERQGRVVLRHQIDIEKSSVKRISCHLGDFINKDGKWVKLEHTGKSLRETYGKLPSILSLITKEQFQLITEEADTAVLIQGIAGSGKTTVALHRLAWLMHKDNSDLKQEDCIIIVLSKALRSYIQNSLPALGLREVRVVTVNDWLEAALKHSTYFKLHSDGIRRPQERCPHGIGRLKRSTALLHALHDYVGHQSEDIRKSLAHLLRWEQLPSGLKATFEKPSNADSLQLLAELKAALKIATEKLPQAEHRFPGICDARKIIEQLVASCSDFYGDLVAILSQPKKIIQYDDTKLIDEGLIYQGLERTKANHSLDVIDHVDDALLLRLIELKCGGIPSSSGIVKRYGHIIVDEVQDLSSVEIANMVGAIAQSRQMTLVGDTAQKLDETSPFPGWDKLREDPFFRDRITRFVALEVSHRSTLPIMRIADYIQQQRVVKEGRPGRVPIYFKCRTESHGIRSAINWLNKALERYTTTITAVICADSEIARLAFGFLKPTFGPTVRLGTQDNFSFEEGIVVTDILPVKGLEFCNVLLWNPSKRSFPSTQMSRNMLYVAVTRAEENLCIISWQNPAEALPPLSSKLIRGVDLALED